MASPLCGSAVSTWAVSDQLVALLMTRLTLELVPVLPARFVTWARKVYVPVLAKAGSTIEAMPPVSVPVVRLLQTPPLCCWMVTVALLEIPP